MILRFKYYDKIPSFLRNKYFLTLTIFIIWILLLHANNLIERYRQLSDLRKLRNEKEYYIRKIEEDRRKLNELKTDNDNLEKFAREQYKMKRKNEDLYIVLTPQEVHQLQERPRFGVVAQTTQSYGNFSEIVLKLLRLTNELRVFNTICNATSERQDAARSLSRVVDAMIVVGGRNSANTTRLASLCCEEGRPTYHIEHADEIRPEWLTRVARVGVTAGASTPDWIVEAVVRRLADSDKKA